MSISFLLSLLLVAGSTHASEAADSQSRAAVMKAENAWDDAFVRRDTRVVRALTADEFLEATNDGQFAARSDLVDSTRTDALRFSAVSTSHVLTRVYGDVAINTGTLHMDLTIQGVASGGDFLFTNVWRKREGRWQVVVSAAGPTEAQQKKDDRENKGRPAFPDAASFKTAAELARGMPSAPAQITAAIIKREADVTRAYIRRDRATLQSLFSDDYTDVWGGTWKTKAQDIRVATGGVQVTSELSSFGYVVRSYGDFAIFLGSKHNRGHYRGSAYDENANVLDVWHREGGKWVVVASQSVHCARPPTYRKSAPHAKS